MGLDSGRERATGAAKSENQGWQLCKCRLGLVTSAISGIKYQVSRYSFRTQYHLQATKPTTADRQQSASCNDFHRCFDEEVAGKVECGRWFGLGLGDSSRSSGSAWSGLAHSSITSNAIWTPKKMWLSCDWPVTVGRKGLPDAPAVPVNRACSLPAEPKGPPVNHSFKGESLRFAAAEAS